MRYRESKLEGCGSLTNKSIESPLIDGRLMRQMINSNLPYDMQLQIIHHDNHEFDLDLGFVRKVCRTLKKTENEWRRLQKKWWESL